ncbi:hypothetical protein BV25DRAFT_1125744 [Artomyces pyxidatus]|uniref:Uncharacterized protein n=1 Tax=Artomyces pyxidatus TaxID=48021 RepID=A0ACB8SUG4_9AGAM|nr:hypothetical protein BV25DRAFT_1125744 [Artomyces pyxidatus]
MDPGQLRPVQVWLTCDSAAVSIVRVRVFLGNRPSRVRSMHSSPASRDRTSVVMRWGPGLVRRGRRHITRSVRIRGPIPFERVRVRVRPHQRPRRDLQVRRHARFPRVPRQTLPPHSFAIPPRRGREPFSLDICLVLPAALLPVRDHLLCAMCLPPAAPAAHITHEAPPLVEEHDREDYSPDDAHRDDGDADDAPVRARARRGTLRGGAGAQCRSGLVVRCRVRGVRGARAGRWWGKRRRWRADDGVGLFFPGVRARGGLCRLGGGSC